MTPVTAAALLEPPGRVVARRRCPPHRRGLVAMPDRTTRRALPRAWLAAVVLLVAVVAGCAPPPVTCDRWHVAVWVRVQQTRHPVCAPDSNADGWPDRDWTAQVSPGGWAWDPPTSPPTATVRKEHP